MVTAARRWLVSVDWFKGGAYSRLPPALTVRHYLPHSLSGRLRLTVGRGDRQRVTVTSLLKTARHSNSPPPRPAL